MRIKLSCLRQGFVELAACSLLNTFGHLKHHFSSAHLAHYRRLVPWGVTIWLSASCQSILYQTNHLSSLPSPCQKTGIAPVVFYFSGRYSFINFSPGGRHRLNYVYFCFLTEVQLMVLAINKTERGRRGRRGMHCGSCCFVLESRRVTLVSQLHFAPVELGGGRNAGDCNLRDKSEKKHLQGAGITWRVKTLKQVLKPIRFEK